MHTSWWEKPVRRSPELLVTSLGGGGAGSWGVQQCWVLATEGTVGILPEARGTSGRVTSRV